MLARLVVVLLAILIAGGLVGGVNAESKPFTIRHFGLSTLRDFGYGDEVRQGTKADYSRPLIVFGLPAGVSQGPHNWYVVRLHVRLTVTSDSGPGKILVSATTDDAACALMEFNVKRANGHPTIKWSSAGIVDGVTEGSSQSGVVELRYANYLANAGVRRGENTLDFQVGPQTGSARVSEFRVFAEDSGIEYTPLSPASVNLDARLASRTPIRVGQRLKVAFTLRNLGERTARKIKISPTYDSRTLSLVRGTSMSVAELRSGRSVTGSVLFAARHPGTTRVFLGGSTSSNHPGDDVTLKILPRK